MGYALARNMRLPDERAFSEHHSIELALRHPSLVQVALYEQHREASTGADLEIWIGDGNEYIATLIQAKKLSRAGRYESLDHRVGKGGRRGFQLDNLLAACASGHYGSHIPLVLMFNGPVGLLPPDRCGNAAVDDDQRGCSIAHALDVVTVATSHGRWERSWASIGRVTWPWQCLFCCPRLASDLPPQRRVVSMLSGTPGPFGDWRPGEADEAIVFWNRSDLPVYVDAALSQRARKLEFVESDLLPAASRVVVISPPTAG
jgi:hypothetical protein